MATIQVAKAPKKRNNKREIYAMVCYYYPQYNLQDAYLMPARDLALLLRTAKKLEAQKMYNLTQIAAAPHTKKGAGVKKLAKHFQKEAK